MDLLIYIKKIDMMIYGMEFASYIYYKCNEVCFCLEERVSRYRMQTPICFTIDHPVLVHKIGSILA